MAKDWNFLINADAIAAAVQQDVEDIYKDLQDGVKKLTIMTHAHVLELASQDLKGYNLTTFMGEGGKNVTWDQVSDNIFVVSLDPSVGYYNDGRPPTSMATEAWLLKNAKTAKDGSKYKVIPFKHDLKNDHGTGAQINTAARNMIRQARTPDNKRISISRIEKNADGTPRIGTLHKIRAGQAPLTQQQAPSLFSKPRGKEEAKATGLKEHGGIFKLQGLVISQRMIGPKVKKEAVTFRVVSSKHNGWRWMYPAIPAGRFMERAFEWATTQAWRKSSKISAKSRLNLLLMGRASNDLILKGFFDYAIHNIRNNLWILTDIYADSDVIDDPLTKVEHGDKEYKNARDWFINNKIDTILYLRRDRPKFPCISIALSSSQEMTSLTSLGDQDHIDYQTDPSQYDVNPDKVIKDFTPVAYNKATGTITMPDGLSTYQVAPLLHMVVENKSSRGFQVLKIVDDKNFQIAANTEIDLKDIYILPVTAAWNTHYNRTRFQDAYEIGVHANSDPVECIWMGQLVEYILLKFKQKYLQERNIQLSTFSISNVSKNENYPVDNVYSRYFSISFQSEMQWIENVFPKIAKTGGGIIIIDGPRTPEALQEQMAKQYWHMPNDDGAPK